MIAYQESGLDGDISAFVHNIATDTSTEYTLGEFFESDMQFLVYE
ncbi:MAG: hypothetical protein Q7S00_00775 [bacterium]|nr:hypothetical protein [bacterium]